MNDFDLCRSECYVINMDKRTDKMSYFEENFKKSGFKKYTRFSGVEGIQPDVIRKYGLNLDYTSMNKGEIGCLCSHVSIYEHMIRNQIPYAVIFEDDVIFKEDFLTKWHGVIDQMEHSGIRPDVIYIGGRTTTKSMEEGFLEMDINLPSPYYKKPVYEKYPPFMLNCNELVFMGAFAYCISLKSAIHMLNNMRRIQVNKPIDLYMTILHHHTGKQIFYCDPMLCYSTLEFDSDIAKHGARYK
jgi:GR25 family glycosyltransferase involved in LPS biosynthesis